MSESQQDLERRIRERAYFLWLEAGSPEGLAEAHWRQAREELDAMARREAQERYLDDEDADSFPASDPPSHTGITGERSA